MSKITAAQFNTKYNVDVNKNSFNFITPQEMKSKEKVQLSGKIQSVWKDVFKRFFKNKWNIVFFAIFIVIISMIIIVPMVVKNPANQQVSNSVMGQIRFSRPSWINGWNHETQDMSIAKFLNYYKHDGIGIFDKKDVLSHVFNKDAAGHNIGVHVEFINKFATKTFMGTDSVGRDVWSRLFSGARWSLSLALIVATVETIIGTTVGIYIGYHVGGRVDTISMRVIEIFKSVPSLLWMFIFALVIGTSFSAMAFVLILVGWVGPVYTARMFTLKVKDEEFIKAAKSLGVSQTGVLFRHVLPNVVGRLLVSFVHRIPAVIFAETTLVFLGMPVGSGDGLSIGNLIQDARTLNAISNNIMYALSISIFLLTFSVSLQIIANGIRDAFDPKTEGGK